MTNNIADVSGKLRKTADTLRAGAPNAGKAAAEAARRAMLGVSGAPHRVANRPTTVKARQIRGGDTPLFSVRWTGPAHLVNNPTRPHDIGPRGYVGTRGTGRKAQRGAALLGFFGLDARSGRGAVKLSDGALRSVVHHPGTRGKNFVEKGKRAAPPRAAKAWRDETRRQLARGLSG